MNPLKASHFRSFRLSKKTAFLLQTKASRTPTSRFSLTNDAFLPFGFHFSFSGISNREQSKKIFQGFRGNLQNHLIQQPCTFYFVLETAWFVLIAFELLDNFCGVASSKFLLEATEIILVHSRHRQKLISHKSPQTSMVTIRFSCPSAFMKNKLLLVRRTLKHPKKEEKSARPNKRCKR